MSRRRRTRAASWAEGLFWGAAGVCGAVGLMLLADSVFGVLCESQGRSLAGAAQAFAALAMLLAVWVAYRQLGLLERQYEHRDAPRAVVWVVQPAAEGVPIAVASETDLPLSSVAVRIAGRSESHQADSCSRGLLPCLEYDTTEKAQQGRAQGSVRTASRWHTPFLKEGETKYGWLPLPDSQPGTEHHWRVWLKWEHGSGKWHAWYRLKPGEGDDPSASERRFTLVWDGEVHEGGDPPDDCPDAR